MADPINLYVDQQASLTATINTTGSGPLGDQTANLEWTTSNASVASFVEWGSSGAQYLASITGRSQVLVEGLFPGTAAVTLTLGSFTDTLAITVSSTPEVNVSSVSITVGK